MLVLAEAQHVGDVLGRFRFLQQRARAASESAALSQTDWDAVAAVGADVAATVERLRAYIMRSVRSLPLDAPADDRASKLERVVAGGKLVESLGLLVVAEQSMFLWHRLRLLQVGRREPDHLKAALADARDALVTAQRLDGEMVAKVHEVLSEYGSLRPAEFHRRLSRRSLQEDVASLRTALEEFAAARNAQVSSWPDLADPTFREAVDAINNNARALGGAVKEIGTVAVSGAGRALTKWGERLQRAARERDEAATSDQVRSEEDDPTARRD